MKAISRRSIAAGLLAFPYIALSQAACSLIAPPKAPGATPLPGEAFVPFPSPRDFDPPGRIFRVDTNGDVRRLAILDLKPHEGNEVIPSVKTKAGLSLSSVLETIGIPASTFPASAKVELDKTREFSLASLNGRRVYLEDDQVRGPLAKYLSTVSRRSDNKYYLVRETVRTTSLTYQARKAWVAGAGIEAQFKGSVSAKAGLRWDTGEEFAIDTRFTRPLDVWYVADELEFKPALGAGPGQISVERQKNVTILGRFASDLTVDP